MNRLSGIEAKIERAAKHINDFDAEWRTFAARAYTLNIADELDGDGRRPVRLSINEEVPTSLSACVGDAINNLRTALDYLIYQLLDLNHIDVGPHHYFPIGRDADHFASSYAGKVQGIGQTAEELIKGLKPYKGGTDGFWQLDELCKRDKHRLLVTVMVKPPDTLAIDFEAITSAMMATLRGVEPENPPAPFSGQYLLIRGTPDPCRVMQDGDIVTTYPADPASSEGLGLGLEMAFGQGELLECEPVSAVLRKLLDLVYGAVYPFRPILAE